MANEDKQIVIYPKYRILTDFNEGLAVFWKNINSNGFINKRGIEVHEGNYTDIRPFEGGIAEVWHNIGQKFSKDEYEFHNNPFDVRRNYLNHSFELLIPQKYDSIGLYIQNNMRIIKKAHKFGFLDEDGNEIIPPILDDIDIDSTYFWNSLRRIKSNKKFGYIDTENNKIVINFLFDETLPSTSNTTWVRINQTWYLMNMNLQVFKKGNFELIHWIVPSEVSAVQTDLGYVMIDSKGNLLSEQIYDYIFVASEGIAPVLKNGKYGYVDISGNQIIAPDYDKAFYFKNGTGLVLSKYVYWHITREGKVSFYKIKPSVLKKGLIIIAFCLSFLYIFRFKILK